jgi:hypothetical protein
MGCRNGLYVGCTIIIFASFVVFHLLQLLFVFAAPVDPACCAVVILALFAGFVTHVLVSLFYEVESSAGTSGTRCGARRSSETKQTNSRGRAKPSLASS